MRSSLGDINKMEHSKTIKVASTLLALVFVVAGGKKLFDYFKENDGNSCLAAVRIGNDEATFKECSRLSQQGDVMAMALVAKSYEDGSYVEKNYEKAEELYLSVASSNDKASIAGEFGLGELYMKSDFKRHDPALSAQWYKKAADKGHKLAQTKYGAMLAGGIGTEQNIALAKVYLQKAASNGVVNAKTLLEKLEADVTR